MKKIHILWLWAAFTQTACAEVNVWNNPTSALASPKEMTVYRSPTCSCCEKWIGHMQKHGFLVKEVMEEDMVAVKQRLGVPTRLQSCHTAVVDGFVVEGHVPAGDVKKLLAKKSKVFGLAAPGMPAGSPGMEMAGTKANFSVLGFDKQGNAKTFTDYSDY